MLSETYRIASHSPRKNPVRSRFIRTLETAGRHKASSAIIGHAGASVRALRVAARRQGQAHFGEPDRILARSIANIAQANRPARAARRKPQVQPRPIDDRVSEMALCCLDLAVRSRQRPHQQGTTGSTRWTHSRNQPPPGITAIQPLMPPLPAIVSNVDLIRIAMFTPKEGPVVLEWPWK